MTKTVKGSPGRARSDMDAAAATRRDRYGTLPPRPDAADLVEETPAEPPADPELGRDSNRDWMLRYS
jgi:hypothetical protein